MKNARSVWRQGWQLLTEHREVLVVMVLLAAVVGCVVGMLWMSGPAISDVLIDSSGVV